MASADHVAAPRTSGSPARQWIKAGIQIGLLGGFIAVSITLQGMIQAFSTRDIVSGMLSMSQALLLITFFATAYFAISRIRPAPTLVMLVIGFLAGLVSSASVVVFISLGTVLPFGSVFVNATARLYELLTFGQGLTTGSLILLVLGIAMGIGSALVLLLPSRARRSMMTGIVAVLTLGVLQDWVIRTVSNSAPLVEVSLTSVSRAVYLSNGLAPVGAAGVFVLIAVLTFLWPKKGTALLAVDQLPSAGRTAYRAASIGLPLLLLLLLPVLLGIENSDILDNVGLYLLMGIGLNIVVGFAGLLDLGYVAFYAIGAYTVGVLTSPEFSTGVIHSWWLALPFAVTAALLAGVILGIPVLKMRGDYLAIVTLGFGEIIRLLALSDWLKPYIGGAQGIQGIRMPSIGPIEFGPMQFTLPLLGQIQFQIQQEFYYVTLAGCLFAGFVAIRVKNSRLGRAWMAMREDEDVAQAMGINLVATKLLAFGMGAFFGGMSGAIFASKLQSSYPHSFNFIVSINVLSLIIVGGMGSIPGVVVGALALVGLPELLREFAEFRYLLYGIVLVMMMLTRPEGLLPEARRRLELEEFRKEEEKPPTLEGEAVIMKTMGQP